MAAIAATLNKNDIDAMIIAGDIANDYELTLQTLSGIETASGVRCLFVPGNHDIWSENHPAKTAWDIYDALKEFDGNLVNGPVELDHDWVVIGDLGWYDYTFGSQQFTVEEFDRMKLNDRLWQDKNKTVWGTTTLEMHRHFHNKLKKQLDAHKNSNIILVTHVLPIADFTVQPPGSLWRYMNAFLGSKQYGELALDYSVRYSISGHVHYRKQKTYENTTFICNCLNYASQWSNNNDPVLEVARAIKIIEIS